MSTLILNDKTASMPIGQLLHSTTDPNIEIRDEAGAVVAEIFLRSAAKPEVCHEHLMRAEAEIEKHRRRLMQDPALDITTAELLDKARSLVKE